MTLIKTEPIAGNCFLSERAIKMEEGGSKFLIMGWGEGVQHTTRLEGGYVKGPHAYLIKVNYGTDADIIKNGETLIIEGTPYKIHNDNKWKEWELEKIYEHEI